MELKTTNNQKEYARSYQIRNREQIIAKRRKYNDSHREESKERSRKYRILNKETIKEKKKLYRAKNHYKTNAQKIAYCAIRDGNLVRQPCIECGDLKVEAHHPDYSKPLEVIWLCRSHHRILHNEEKRRQYEPRYRAGNKRQHALCGG